MNYIGAWLGLAAGAWLGGQRGSHYQYCYVGHWLGNAVGRWFCAAPRHAGSRYCYVGRWIGEFVGRWFCGLEGEDANAPSRWNRWNQFAGWAGWYQYRRIRREERTGTDVEFRFVARADERVVYEEFVPPEGEARESDARVALEQVHAVVRQAMAAPPLVEPEDEDEEILMLLAMME